MPVPGRILELTDRFGYNLESYKKGIYNETQVRLEYINPLMEELGWDISNKQGYSEALHWKNVSIRSHAEHGNERRRGSTHDFLMRGYEVEGA